MDTHPLITHQVARMRNEDRITHGLAAYSALRACEEQAPERSAAGALLRGSRLLDRLVRRQKAGECAARPAV